MLWVTLILGQVLVFALVGFWMFNRNRQFIYTNMIGVQDEEVAEEEPEEQATLVQQMLWANDKDDAIQELILGQRIRLKKAGLPDEVIDHMTTFLYQRLWT